MGRRGAFILIAILLILSAVAVLALLFMQPRTDGTTGPVVGGEPTSTSAPAVTAVPQLEIIHAAQNLERGVVIPTEALVAIPWPTTIVPPSAITDTSQVVGTRARYTIAQGEPIFSTMIVQSLLQLSPTGSDAAAQIPPGFVAISIPYDKEDGVSLGVRDGDHVNVIVSWALVDLDQNFQTVLPNQSSIVSPPNPDNTLPIDPSVVAVARQPQGPFGRGEPGVNIADSFYVVPSEPQRPRYVTQAIIQDAIVLHLGDFGPDKPTVILPTPTLDATQQAAAGSPVPPTATPAPPATITLIVSPQDALVLNYVKRVMEHFSDSVKVTLALRSAGDTSRVETESVTLQYMFETYNIAVPTRLNYGPAGPVSITNPAPTPAAPAP